MARTKAAVPGLRRERTQQQIEETLRGERFGRREILRHSSRRSAMRLRMTGSSDGANGKPTHSSHKPRRVRHPRRCPRAIAEVVWRGMARGESRRREILRRAARPRRGRARRSPQNDGMVGWRERRAAVPGLRRERTQQQIEETLRGERFGRREILRTLRTNREGCGTHEAAPGLLLRSCGKV